MKNQSVFVSQRDSNVLYCVQTKHLDIIKFIKLDYTK